MRCFINKILLVWRQNLFFYFGKTSCKIVKEVARRFYWSIIHIFITSSEVATKYFAVVLNKSH